MKPRTWIEQMEKQYPARSTVRTTVEPALNFRVAGMPRADVQRKYVKALETGISDPRATPKQRALWRGAGRTGSSYDSAE